MASCACQAGKSRFGIQWLPTHTAWPKREKQRLHRGNWTRGVSDVDRSSVRLMHPMFTLPSQREWHEWTRKSRNGHPHYGHGHALNLRSMLKSWAELEKLSVRLLNSEIGTIRGLMACAASQWAMYAGLVNTVLIDAILSAVLCFLLVTRRSDFKR